MMRLLNILLVFVVSDVYAEENVQYALIEIKSDKKSISFLNNAELNPELNVKNIAAKEGDVVINGGYYSKDYKSLGYLKINRVEINPKINSGLSGMLLLDMTGDLKIDWSKSTAVGQFDGVLQNGPFLIDPGGKLGINTDDGRLANRVCVGRKINGSIVLVYSAKTTLFKLASMVHDEHPDISELLNMDGGPMAGMWSHDDAKLQFNNLVPAISYIKFSAK